MRYYLPALTCLVGIALFVTACSSSQKSRILVHNPAQVDRPDELVIFSRSLLESRLGAIPANRSVAVKDAAGRPVPVQQDDLDGDGSWDEVALLHSFTAGQELAFYPRLVKARAVNVRMRAHVRHRKKTAGDDFGTSLLYDSIGPGLPATDFSRQALPPYLAEGPGWENDKIGFRLYFDARNGKDIWGKTTADMILDTVGTKASGDYHRLADWGMDILKVGPSLGAGALAVHLPLQGQKDSLVRVGGSHLEGTTYTRIADGPLRAVFRMSYRKQLLAEDLSPVDITETIQIWGGQYFYESMASLVPAGEGALPVPGASLATGLVNLHQADTLQLSSQGVTALYTWKNQSENKDGLGMALLAATQQIAALGKTPDIDTDIRNTYTMTMKPEWNKGARFRFYGGWERTDPRFASREVFRKFLEEEMIRFANPLQYH